MTAAAKLMPFNMKNLPLVVDVVLPLWAPPVGDDEFKRFNVEYIVRNNISENDYRFELIEDAGTNGTGATTVTTAPDPFLAAAFFTRKGDPCAVNRWYEKVSARFSTELRQASNMSRTYLTLMDERTLNLMNDDDIKLSLFVSRKPGAGSRILSQTCKILKAQGWKKLYLWTDCDCNWQWYTKHGFELVKEDSYEPFSSKEEAYKTYIFRKAL